MSRQGDLMRKAIKRHLLPVLERLGFTGTAAKFQRLLPESQDLLAIQYHKYGGSFILEFGRRERGSLPTSWGPIVPEEKVEVMHLPVMMRARLQETEIEADGLFFGFVFRDFGADAEPYDLLAQRVAGLVPQIDAWLSTGVKGPNVHTFG